MAGSGRPSKGKLNVGSKLAEEECRTAAPNLKGGGQLPSLNYVTGGDTAATPSRADPRQGPQVEASSAPFRPKGTTGRSHGPLGVRSP